jgi:CheY-like chemotaxis protein
MEAHPMTAGSETILLVEDEPQLRRSVRRQLDGLGYQVLEADAGEAALDILRSNPEVDLLFTDLVMPGGMSGFDLVRHARALIPGLKVLLTTGYAAETDETITNIREPILKKPYKKEKLTRALREALKTAA